MKDDLVLSHLPLAKYMGSIGYGIPIDDAQQEAVVALIKAAEKYQPDHGAKFSTFARNVIRNHLITQSVVYSPIVPDARPATKQTNDQQRHAVMSAMEKLAPNVRKALEMRYGDDDASYEQIGIMLGCSHTYAREVVAAGLVKLKRLMERE